MSVSSSFSHLHTSARLSFCLSSFFSRVHSHSLTPTTTGIAGHYCDGCRATLTAEAYRCVSFVLFLLCSQGECFDCPPSVLIYCSCSVRLHATLTCVVLVSASTSPPRP